MYFNLRYFYLTILLFTDFIFGYTQSSDCLSKKFFTSVTFFLNSFLHIVRAFSLFIIIILHNPIIPKIVIMSESGLYTALALQSSFSCLLTRLLLFFVESYT